MIPDRMTAPAPLRPATLQRSPTAPKGGTIEFAAPGSTWLSGALRAHKPKKLGIHRLEELGIAFGVSQLVEQEIDGIHGAHRVENATQYVHLFEHVGWREQFFLASTRPSDVDGRECPFVRDLAIKDQLRIAGALEFF